MKKLIFLKLLILLNITSMCFTQSSEASNELQLSALRQESNTTQNDWPRVRAQFDVDNFLEECKHKHGFVYNNSRSINDNCWDALFILRNKYNYNNRDNKFYFFAYQCIIKFLLSYDFFPANYKNKQLSFIDLLIGKFRHRLAPTFAKNSKIKKWCHIHLGMLYLKKASMSTPENGRSTYISNAYNEFSEAVKLKTTRTSYLLAAETILDYGHTPENMTREEVKKLAFEYINIAFTKIQKKSSPKCIDVTPQEVSTVEKFARPTYLRDLAKIVLQSEALTVDSLDQIAPETLHDNSVAQNSIDLGLAEAGEQSDPLLRQNFHDIVIPTLLNDDNLPLRNKSFNHVGGLNKTYTINGRKVKRQNVSGENMRCFFNAIGLNVDGQIEQLVFFANDPIVRYMIANEIVSGAMIDSLPNQVKQAAGYAIYAAERTKIDQLEEERNALLAAQNSDTNLQNVTLLDPKYQELNLWGDIIRAELRRRAFSRKSFLSFIKYSIKSGEMMVMHPDIDGDPRNNYSSINAIAYLEKIGIKIFTPDEDDTLHCTHSYIPEGATEVAYLYYANHHFQALVPSDLDRIDEDESDTEESEEESREEERRDSDAEEPVIFPNSEELQELYPAVKTLANGRSYDADLVRKVLYCYDIHMPYKQVNKSLNLTYYESYTISKTNNKVIEKTPISEAIKEKILQAYLECYDDLNSKKITLANFSNEFFRQSDEKEKIELKNEKRIATFLQDSNKRKVEYYDNEKSENVFNQYLEGIGFYKICQNSSLNIKTVLYILIQKVKPKHYKNPINLKIKEVILSKDERIKICIDKFNELKNKNGGKPPRLKDLISELTKYGMSRSWVKRNLVDQNICFKKKIYSSYLSQEVANEIRNEFIKRNPEPNDIPKTYKLLAKKYEISYDQVRNIFQRDKYRTKTRKEDQKSKNYDLLVKTFHELQKLHPTEMKIRPVQMIQESEKVSLSYKTIKKYLKKAGLHTAHKGIHTIKSDLTKRPRSDSSEEENEEGQPAKKKRKDA